MALYRTEYKLPQGGRRTTTVYARDAAHLEELITLRGMGETVVTDTYFHGLPQAPVMPSEHLKARELGKQRTTRWSGSR